MAESNNTNTEEQQAPPKKKKIDPKKQALLDKRKKYDPRAAIKNSKKLSTGTVGATSSMEPISMENPMSTIEEKPVY